MEVVYSHCCGLDVHKKIFVASSSLLRGKEIRIFSTMMDGLLSMVDRLKDKGCTHVAMESTGSL
ncbi:MAG: hypothetical protein BWX92_03278 [Deltaproteobacteria bacterium ADurb.Bin135]|nr:MAG: hypothetical protein BWX92_03278 [Deltaproteobacteria bacterium ADurb.Bin135]